MVTVITWTKLDESTDNVDNHSIHEEKQEHAAHTDEDQEGRKSDEERGGLEVRWQDGVEVIESSGAVKGTTRLEELAIFVQSKVSGSGASIRVSDPLWLDEYYYVDDGKTNGEHTPHNSNSSGVTDIVCVIDPSSFSILWDLHFGSFLSASTNVKILLAVTDNPYEEIGEFGHGYLHSINLAVNGHLSSIPFFLAHTC